ncbi:hypothetical protein [Nostoc sp. CALU 546]
MRSPQQNSKEAIAVALFGLWKNDTLGFAAGLAQQRRKCGTLNSCCI